MESVEIKFSGRSRLYVGNLAASTTEESIKEMMSPYGEVGEVFHDKEKKFAFLKFATRHEAEKARKELNGQMKNGQQLKVRFAPHPAAIKVCNLGPWVSNELLYKGFSIFGEIERAVVYVDERGKSKGEGIVEFTRRPMAMEAVKRCNDGCFFLTSSIRPVIAELQDEVSDEEGFPEKSIIKKNDYYSAREIGPRFASSGSFEFDYSTKWKALYEMRKQKLIALDREMKLEEDKLVAQMEYAKYEHETEKMRAELREREANRDQRRNQWEQRERETQEMLRVEQERRAHEEEAMTNRLNQQDANLRQRQHENSMFMQAQEMNNLLDRQEAEMKNRHGPGGPFGGGNPNGNGPFQNGPGGPFHGGPGGPPGGPFPRPTRPGYSTGNMGMGRPPRPFNPMGGRGRARPWGGDDGHGPSKRGRF